MAALAAWLSVRYRYEYSGLVGEEQAAKERQETKKEAGCGCHVNSVGLGGGRLSVNHPHRNQPLAEKLLLQETLSGCDKRCFSSLRQRWVDEPQARSKDLLYMQAQSTHTHTVAY